jgi:ethanolamine kinase
MAESIRHIPLRYDNANSQESALNLILALRPEWKETRDTIEFVRFKDGITNTVCGQKNEAYPSRTWTVLTRLVR